MKWKSLLAASVLGLSTLTVVASPARADTAAEISAGCEHTGPSMGSAGYTVVDGGVEYGVSITVGWQYVGGSWSNCEDINVAPDANQTLWNAGVIKVRTYMCNSAGSCWHNAWRNCQGGCQAATDMANGAKYQVHFYGLQSPGYWIHEYD